MRERLVAWERMRLWYNGLMLAAGLPVARSFYLTAHSMPATERQELLIGSSLFSVVLASVGFAILANLLFFTGPALEAYAVTFTRIRWDERWRLGLFLVGLALSLAVVLIAWMESATLAITLMG